MEDMKRIKTKKIFCNKICIFMGPNDKGNEVSLNKKIVKIKLKKFDYPYYVELKWDSYKKDFGVYDTIYDKIVLDLSEMTINLISYANQNENFELRIPFFKKIIINN